MLIVNLWTDAGLCNGATGPLVHFIYAPSHHPPDLHVAVIVKFDYYHELSIMSSLSNRVPISQ